MVKCDRGDGHRWWYMGWPSLGAKLSEVPWKGLEATTAGGKAIVEAMGGCMLLGEVGDMTGGEPQKTGQ